nr:hypothetical protein [Klebsiella pneumoniae]
MEREVCGLRQSLPAGSSRIHPPYERRDAV